MDLVVLFKSNMNIVHYLQSLLPLLAVLQTLHLVQCLPALPIYDDNNRLNLSASCPNATCSMWQLETNFQQPLRYTGNQVLQLQELLLANCQMRSMPVELLRLAPNLRVLLLQNSSVHVANRNDFQSIPLLKHLHLQRNRITQLREQQFAELKQLEVLQLGYNTIGMVNRLAFVGLTQLRLLGLQGNGLRELLDGVFETLPNLVHVDLSDNEISAISSKTFAKNNKLQTLLLKGNKFEHFEPNSLAELTDLRLLDLSNCQLDELLIRSVHKLLIESSGLRGLIINGGVINLKAGNNALTQLQIADKSAVIELDLHENQFDGNATATLLNGMWNLQHLNLSKNKIDSLYTGGVDNCRSLSLLLPSLTHLDLSHNQLESLPPAASLFPNQLIELDISYNHLITVQAVNFAALPNLQRLNLQHIRLTQLDYKLLHKQLPNLQVLVACDSSDYSFMHKLTIYLKDRGVYLPLTCGAHKPDSQYIPNLPPESEAQTQCVAGVGGIHPYWTTRDVLAFVTLVVVFLILLMQLYHILEEEGWLRRMRLWLSGSQPPATNVNGSRRRRLHEEDSEGSSA